MKKTIIACAVLCLALSQCGMNNKMVRNSYANKKISSTDSIPELTRMSSSIFHTYMKFKTSRGCDFDLWYFLAYSYHVHGQYNSTDIDIFSSLLDVKELYVTLANVGDDALQKAADGGYVLKTYMLSNNETLLTKDMICELKIAAKQLVPGACDGSLTITDNTNKVLFDSNLPGSTLSLSIDEVQNNIVRASVRGTSTVDHKTMIIHNGTIWAKI